MQQMLRAMCAALLLGSLMGNAPHPGHVPYFFDNRNYLSKAVRSSGWTPQPSAISTWKASRKQDILSKIASLPDSIKAILVARAKGSLNYAWPPLSDDMYAEFKANGNRSDYEGKFNNYSTALYTLAIAELVTQDPKYMQPLANGIRAFIGTRTWVLPAHAEVSKGPGPQNGNVDLISAETSASLAEIQWLLSDQLKAAAPDVYNAINIELSNRLFIPYLSRKDFFWMGYGNSAPNNWNPWINSNVLAALFYTVQDPDTLNQVFSKVVETTDKFINGYPDDGGCNEGPGYWSEAGGRLIQILDLISSASGGRVSLQGNDLIHNMGTYIYKMHISGAYFANFGDAPPKTIPPAESVYQYGALFNDPVLKGFGGFLFSLNPKSITTQYMVGFVTAANLYQTLSTTAPAEPPQATFWQPDLQILTVKSRTAKNEVFLAVQGGNNGKSHNHNDVGSFILYVNGKPVLMDAGVATYTATTFSKDRYSLWYMQSAWHSCPLINGVQQSAGTQYAATNQSFNQQGNDVTLSMDVAKAYPAPASVQSWVLNYDFNTSTNNLSLGMSYQLNNWKDSSMFNFLTCCNVTLEGNDKVNFTDDQGHTLLVLGYSPGFAYPRITVQPVDDKEMKSFWGDHLTRVSLVINNNRSKDAGKFDLNTQ